MLIESILKIYASIDYFIKVILTHYKNVRVKEVERSIMQNSSEARHIAKHDPRLETTLTERGFPRKNIMNQKKMTRCKCTALDRFNAL